MNLERDLNRIDFLFRLLLLGLFILVAGLLTANVIVRSW